MNRKVTMKNGFLKTTSIALAGVLFSGVLGGCSAILDGPYPGKPTTQTDTEASQLIAITNVRIFDGENLIEDDIVVIDGDIIQSVGGEIPDGATIIDGGGGTLMPGLIDSHVHTDMDGLRTALKFGVTTELEMQGRWTDKERRKVTTTNDVADLRSPGMGVTAKDGHPTQYMKDTSNLIIRWFYKFPSVSTPEEAVKHVDNQIDKNGADYIKVFIESGETIGYPGLPVLSDDVLKAAIDEAHKRDKIVISHATTVEGAQRVVDLGVDGLGHLFFDNAPSENLVADIAEKDIFVIPTLVTLSTAFGNDAAWLAEDERVSSKLDKKWLDHLSRSANAYPEGNLEDAFATVMALHDAGVDILAGCDVSEPIEGLGGLAHGASLHHELQLLVKAGLTPTEALRAATSVPARRFELTDRGKIIVGARADLLLIDGDPLTDISDTLSIKTVWRGGVELTAQK